VIALVVRLKAAAGNAEAVEAGLRKMTELVHAHEPGCSAYVVHRAQDDRDLFVLYERYDDEASLEAHRDSDHFRECIAEAVVPLLAERSREDLIVLT